MIPLDFARRRGASLAIVACLLFAACAPTAVPPDATASPGRGTPTTSALWDSRKVHTIALSFDADAYAAMIAAFVATGDKEWIEATVTIDGTDYRRAGIRLKGNSSLGRLAEGRSADGSGTSPDAQPESLPWLVSLDRFVDGQAHDGATEFVIRSNPSATALNEAVALELLERAGLASQDAIAVRFSVNGGDEVLRLVIEHPDDAWMSQRFSAAGALYKAESTGDYRYRGDDPKAYDEVFDQEAGHDNADLTPLIEFLEFINNADDATWAAEIEDRLDVDAFATYLAMQELIANFDDIDGPGNNSYLHYDPGSGRFTVVPWDNNLAFGSGGLVDPVGGGAGGPPRAPGASPGPPGPGRPPQPAPSGLVEEPAGGGNGERPPGRGDLVRGSNVLAERFLKTEAYRTLVEERKAQLTADLWDSGVAAGILADWVAVLETQAADLVDAATLERESAQIADQL